MGGKRCAPEEGVLARAGQGVGGEGKARQGKNEGQRFEHGRSNTFRMRGTQDVRRRIIMLCVQKTASCDAGHFQRASVSLTLEECPHSLPPSDGSGTRT